MKTSGKILEPQTRQRVGRRIEIQGELNDVPSGDHFWVAVKIAGLCWPKEPEITNANGAFTVTIYEGGSPPGGQFSIALLQLSSNGHELIKNWIRRGRESGDYPGLTLSDAIELDIVEVRL